MAGRISLCLAIHNHQPIGNFGWVIQDVYERAYRPMVEALEGHPQIRLAIHDSGPLLGWLRTEQRGHVDRLRALQDRGQVEIMGGGWYEPILASLPERDRIEQLRRMADELEATFGRRPTGAWLAERVWEPDLPVALTDAGYRWTILDDAHFRAASIAEDRLWGTFTTEDQGRLLTVFGTEQGLRYRIPFGDVDDVIDHLRDHATEAGDRLGTMGDDGEKFGAWPTTWEHCWGSGRWVERFFEAIEANADWLTTVTPSAWLEGSSPIGRVQIPTSSYAEMGEWALPAEESVAFAAAVQRAHATGAPEARWLRGASWRNFQVRYREINDLHKQMLRISDKVATLAEGPVRRAALDHLGRGQSNDCYWHGLFGGIYLSHLRLATHAELIAAEDLADRALGTTAVGRLADLDLDGRDEVELADAGQVVTVDLDEGAGIGAWDLRAPRHAVTAVLRRRPEADHERLRAAGRVAVSVGDGGLVDPGGRSEAVAADVRSKEPGLADRLHDDAYERRSALVRVLDLATSQAGWADGTATELGDALGGAFEVEELGPGLLVARRDGAVRVSKSISLGGRRLQPALEVITEVENRGREPIHARVGVEWATTMLGGGGNPAAWWEVDGDRIAHDRQGAAAGIASLAQGNDELALAIRTTIEPAVDAWWAPIETVSNSEDGFERVYQGSALLLSQVVRMAPGDRFRIAIRHVATVERDLAADEPVVAGASR
ncbi:MAG TPA: alpha-amylase/4-alpha-glucanotransferase domain-containing protein [Candidatus Limnocylindrales bacterium]|jgi:alpha-amylase